VQRANHKFAVILPVRNGGAYLKICIESILAQDHEDFRLLVLDNASTDDTVCYLSQLGDSRVSISETTVPLSIEENWARISRLGMTDEFMTIIGHDDLLDPEYLSRMSALIDTYPDAALYQAHFRLIDGRGRKVRSCLPMPVMETVHEFLTSRLRLRRDSYGTGYMFRASDYARVGGILPYKKLMFADDALWMRLMRGSYKATLPNEAFSYRLHPGGTSHSPDWRSTFDSLGEYLAFLIELASNDSAVKAALDQYLPEYVEFWFRWGFFSAVAQEGDREEMLGEMARLSAIVRLVIGSKHLPEFDARISKALFGIFPHMRWFIWQVCRYLRIRYLRK
jgi:glycosyltransferase involved in cell wall biosynthesis